MAPDSIYYFPPITNKSFTPLNRLGRVLVVLTFVVDLFCGGVEIRELWIR